MKHKPYFLVLLAAPLAALPLLTPRADPSLAAPSLASQNFGAHPFALEKEPGATPGTFITSMRFELLLAPDGKRLVSFSTGGMGQTPSGSAVWDVASKRLLWQKENNGVFGWEPLCFSPDGTRLVMALNPGPNCCISDNGSRTVGIFDAQSGAQTGALESNGQAFRFQGAAFSRDGKQLATAIDQGVLLWDVAAQKLVSRLQMPAARLTPGSVLSPAIALSGASQLVAANWGKDFLKSVAPQFRTEVRDFKDRLKWKIPNGGAPIQMSFSPDGKLLLMRARNAPFVVREAATGKLKWKRSLPGAAFGEGVWLPDSSALLVAENKNFQMLDAQTGVTRRAFSHDALQNFVIAPDGRQIYSIGYNGKIRRQRLP